VPTLTTRFDRIDARISGWMARQGIRILRVSLGLIFLWFGALKFLPGLSPAEGLAERTVATLTGGVVPAHVALLVLAVWETAIGLGLIAGRFLRTVLLLLFVQMVGTTTPVLLFPGEVFVSFPFALTMEGQYIVKNLVLVSAGLVIGATVRGGRMVSEARDASDPSVIGSPAGRRSGHRRVARGMPSKEERSGGAIHR